MCGSELGSLQPRNYPNRLIRCESVGRTGKQFAYQWEGVQPDIVVIGKGLAGGYVPLSAVLISSKVVDVFRAGTGAFINGAGGLSYKPPI